MGEQKQHEPTPRRKRQARKEGKVLKSQLLAQAVSLFGCICFLDWAMSSGWLHDQLLLDYLWTEGFFNPLASAEITLGCVLEIGVSILGVAAIAGMLTEAAQVGISFEWGAIRPRMDRISPASFGARVSNGLLRSWELVGKLGFCSVFFSWFLWSHREDVFAAVASGSCAPLGEVVMALLRGGATLFLFFGAIDYRLRRKEYFRELSMSHDDVRREAKEDDGDPHVRAIRRSLHEQLIMSDIANRVRRSKVVVVDPNA